MRFITLCRVAVRMRPFSGQVDDFRQTYCRHAYFVAGEGGLLKCLARQLGQSGIGKHMPDGGVSIRDRYDHSISSRPKLANISARFSSISSAEGAGPRWANAP